ncbi:MAG: hypothetical protein PF483_03410 [Halothiobacillus sp.]|jgi:hypothetical protein|nr:hypothetical protein [Halothiobacillus sp.]
MRKKKYKPVEGDIFKYLITDGAVNNGFTIYGYGRVLNSTTAAFYSNYALPPRKSGFVATVEHVLILDVAFVVGCTFDGFENGIYEVIGNVPLENKFKNPIQFYHRAVGETLCFIFNIWASADKLSMDISQVPVQIEQWVAYSHVHVEQRLGIYRANKNA